MANPLYSDVNLWLSPLAPYMVLIDEDAVNQNLLVLCDTPVGSKWFRPTIGSAILSYLFDPLDDVTASAIETELEQMLADNGERRIIITKVDVVPDYDNMRYYVEIRYDAPFLNASRISFRFYLQRERV